LEQIAQRKEARLPDGFVETRVARRMLTVVEQAVRLGGIGLIVAPSGIGKSNVFEAARQVFPGSVVVRVRETCRTGPGLIRHLAQALHVRGASNSISAQAAVIQALAGTNRLLLIDEAHRLADNALELVRDLHDEGGNLPIVLAGTI